MSLAIIQSRLPTPPRVIPTLLRAVGCGRAELQTGPTPNSNSHGAFGIKRWPKMRKIPYKTRFFAFLAVFLNSGFYMIVLPGLRPPFLLYEEGSWRATAGGWNLR
jgi:hypothetical protein